MKNSSVQEILGGDESQVVVGLALYDIAATGLLGYAITVRVTGTIIAAINTINEFQAAAVPYAPTWLGIALQQGDYFISRYPIANITLTAAGDSITIHCNRPY